MATIADHQGSSTRLRARRTLMSFISSTLVGATAFTATVHAAPTNPSDEEIATADRAVGASTSDVARLANTVAESADAIAAIERTMGGLREAVNKALVDLQDARTRAELSRQEVLSAREELNKSQSEIEKAQDELNKLARSAYRSSATPRGIKDVAGSSTSDDELDRRTFLRLRAEEQQQAVDELDAQRTRKANAESMLRVARKDAEEQEKVAEAAEQDARARIDESSSKLEEAQNRRAELIREQAAAESKLQAAKDLSGELRGQRKEYEEFEKAEQERKAREEAARVAEAERAKAEEQARKDAEAAEKAAAAAERAKEADRAKQRKEAEEKRQAAEAAQRAAEQAADDHEKASEAQAAAEKASEEAAEAVVAANQPNHTQLDNPYPTGESEGAAEVPAVSGTATGTSDSTTSGGTSTTGAQSAATTEAEVTKDATSVVTGSRAAKIEAVIARAESQIGVPYAWGGGTATGPSRGIRDGGVADAHGDYNKIGFDCSGLVLYAFAGVGISLPHYSGYQYQRGTKISPSQMQRGDLIFYGANGNQHVAIYLGNGMMIEAPQSGSYVQKSPVRWGGMSPYAVRLI